ncbi:hypothetical protein GQ44DRAFT_825722 [Phaeosphaeriaceae sp. PMI808]|nr:hypothetical protein GQ44DRAFT_825722 [Phaeosphaeriaceae sp. PMI808]
MYAQSCKFGCRSRRVLADASWDIRTQQFIDDYPIGHIRHLSQAFVALAQNRPSLSITEFSINLLLLSCYVSLRKLYINAFSNIKGHLAAGNEDPAHISHDPRTMRLRGMDMLSERCMRSYTAFNITLDLLHNCDAALDLCAVCRPPGPSNSSSPSSSAIQYSHPVTPSNELGDPMENSLSISTCIACALPISFRKDAMPIFSAIADQEHALHEVISYLRGTLRQRMGSCEGFIEPKH